MRYSRPIAVVLMFLALVTVSVARAGWPAANRAPSNKVIPVWPNLKVPQTKRARNLHRWPTLTEYLLPPAKANGTAVVICPGGGYVYEAVHHEGYAIAQWLNTLGIQAFVLNYRLPQGGLPPGGVPWPLQDVRQAMRIVRANARRWHINPKRVGVAGFSAGGHLAAMAGTLFLPGNPNAVHAINRFSTRPDFLILGYPVISMIPGITHPGSHDALLGPHASRALDRYFSADLMVTSLTPPSFICLARNDTVVPLANSIRFYRALKRDHIPAVLRIYNKGEHGFGLGLVGTDSTRWPAACARWLLKIGMIKHLPAKMK